MTRRPLPMFPLGTVLFPHAQLPIHVFEPRYRKMVEDCLGGDGDFGVVLIERGHEVGGGDTRFPVGTLAHIVQAARIPDGRWMLAAVGTRRLRVTEWLPDDPYPRAHVTLLDEATPSSNADAQIREVEQALRRVHALRAELGVPAVTEISLTDDPTRAGFEAAALAPIGPLDAQSLLERDDVEARLEQLLALLHDEANVLEFRLSS